MTENRSDLHRKGAKQSMNTTQRAWIAKAPAVLAAVAAALTLVWVVGHFGESHLQWIPAVHDLGNHAWNNSAQAPSTGIGRTLLVGYLFFLGIAGAAVAGLILGSLAWAVWSGIAQMRARRLR